MLVKTFSFVFFEIYENKSENKPIFMPANTAIKLLRNIEIFVLSGANK